MGLSLESGFVKCANGANQTQHRYRMDLEVAQSLNQAIGRDIYFSNALDDFFEVLSNGEHGNPVQSWSIERNAVPVPSVSLEKTRQPPRRRQHTHIVTAA